MAGTRHQKILGAPRFISFIISLHRLKLLLFLHHQPGKDIFQPHNFLLGDFEQSYHFHWSRIRHYHYWVSDCASYKAPFSRVLNHIAHPQWGIIFGYCLIEYGISVWEQFWKVDYFDGALFFAGRWLTSCAPLLFTPILRNVMNNPNYYSIAPLRIITNNPLLTARIVE